MTVWSQFLSGSYSSNAANIAPTTVTPTGLESPHACAIDVTNGWVLYDKSASEIYEYPASTVKMMTTLLVGEYRSTELATSITWQTSDDLASGLSQVGFQDGDVVTWNDIIHGILMVSGGDACQAAAREIGNELLGVSSTSESGYARFVERMNERAAELGCESTEFSNAHGAEQHKTTARDMAVIAAACFQNATIQARALDTSYTISVTGANARDIDLTNTDEMLAETGVLGAKTGSLFGGGYPTTYSLGVLWSSVGSKLVAIMNLAAPTSADRFADSKAMIASLPTDFPYLSAS